MTTEPNPAAIAVARVAAALSRNTYYGRTETELQEAVGQVLVAEFGTGAVQAELRRGGDRFDFLVHVAVERWPASEDGHLVREVDVKPVVVELKVGGSRADALRQCQRYLGYEDVAGLVCASKKPGVVQDWPEELADKPVRAMRLKGWP